MEKRLIELMREVKLKEIEMLNLMLGSVPNENDKVIVEEEKIEEVEEVEEVEENEVVNIQEDVLDFTNYLEDLDISELKDLANEIGIKEEKTKPKLIKSLVADLKLLEDALENLGYYEDEEEIEDDIEVTEEIEEEIEEVDEVEDEIEEVEDEEVDEVEELDETELNSIGLLLNDNYVLTELAEICTELGLSKTGKKQALIDRILEYHANKGDSPESVIAEYFDTDDSDDIEVTEEIGEVEEVEEEVTEEYRLRLDEEKALIEELDEAYANKDKSLTKAKMKKFLEPYALGNPDELNLDEDSLFERYKEIKVKFISDEAIMEDVEDPYIRDGVDYCCGAEIKELDNGDLYCSICGTQYEVN